MYFSLNNENLIVDFGAGVKVKVGGPDDYYLVEMYEYLDNDNSPRFLEGYKISPNHEIAWRKEFRIPIEFYLDFEVVVHKVIENYGLTRIYNHRYCDYGKVVLFNLETDNQKECELWLERVLEYQRRHQCKVVIESKFPEIDKKFQNFYYTAGIDCYKRYNIGRYPKNSKDFKTMDPRKDGLIWYGNYKTFWSYQHPRSWSQLTSQEIVDDILGLS